MAELRVYETTGSVTGPELRVFETTGTVTAAAPIELRVYNTTGSISGLGTAAVAVDDITINALNTFTLDGSPSMFVTSAIWEQTGGPPVVLTDDETLVATGLAPAHPDGTTASFRLRINGQATGPTVVIRANPHLWFRLDAGGTWQPFRRVRI